MWGGTDWYIEGKAAAGETSEARVILGDYSSLALIKGKKTQERNWQTTNKRKKEREQRVREKIGWETEQECTTAEQQCHIGISLQWSMDQPDTDQQPQCPAICPATGPHCIGWCPQAPRGKYVRVPVCLCGLFNSTRRDGTDEALKQLIKTAVTRGKW